MVKEVAIYLEYKQDESYTPSKISVRAGTYFHDLQVCNSKFFWGVKNDKRLLIGINDYYLGGTFWLDSNSFG